MKATKIKMKPGCHSSNNVLEIDSIYVEGSPINSYSTKSSLYDFLKIYPNTIQVNIYPFPNLKPGLSKYNEKYVYSEPDSTTLDNLLKLPRE